MSQVWPLVFREGGDNATSLPNVSEVRHRIESCREQDIQMLFKTVTLFALRIGEGCGYVYPSEKGVAQPTGMLLWGNQADWQPNMMNYNEVFIIQSIKLMDLGKEPSREEISQIREQAFVLSIVTEKREGYNRKAAIPMNELYERWSPEVFKYITERQEKGPLPHLHKLNSEQTYRTGKPISLLDTLKSKEGDSILENYEPIFPFRRQEILPYATKIFGGFSYPITQYNRLKIDELGRPVQEMKQGKLVNVYEPVPEHQKRFGDHALRHLRSTELKTFFLIEGAALDNFMGWSKPRGGESSAMQDRYVLEPWRAAGYFPKLLRVRA